MLHQPEFYYGLLIGALIGFMLARNQRRERLLKRQLKNATLRYWVLENAAQSVINEASKEPTVNSVPADPNTWRLMREIFVLAKIVRQQQE